MTIKMKLARKSEWFILDRPFMEPDEKWKEGDEYFIERQEKLNGSIVWFGINKNWKKEVDGPWTELATDHEAKPLEKYLPEIVYGSDRTYWKECDTPEYELLYQHLTYK